MSARNLIQQLGGPQAAALKLGVKRTAVQMWCKRGLIPLAHVDAVSRALDLPFDAIRPDAFQPLERSPSAPSAVQAAGGAA